MSLIGWNSGGTAEELKRLAREAPEWTRDTEDAAGRYLTSSASVDEQKRPPFFHCIGTVPLSDVQPEEVSWLWDGRIPFGKLTSSYGDPGLGKSTLALEVAARLTRGERLPGGGLADVSSVLISRLEDGLGDTIRPRLEAAGADVSRVFAIKAVSNSNGEEEFPCLRHVNEIEEAIEAHAARLLPIVDPLMAYLGGETNSWRDQDVRRALALVAAMAERTGRGRAHHSSPDEGRGVERGVSRRRLHRGSAARPEAFLSSPRTPKMRSDGSWHPPSRTSAVLRIRWRIDYVMPAGSPGVEFETGSVLLTRADQLLAAQVQTEDHGARAEAEGFLRELLANGAVPANDVFKAARAAGISEITLEAWRRCGSKSDPERADLPAAGYGSAGRRRSSEPER